MAVGGRVGLAAARRIALAAQGFGRPRPATVTLRHVQGVVDRVAQFQIDSVSVVTRAHYWPLYARLGPYDTALLDRAAGQPPRRLFEYWGHAASLLDVRLEPALRTRMTRADHPPDRIGRILSRHPHLADQVLAEVAEGGPLPASGLSHQEERVRGTWWSWSEAKHVAEWLFDTGRLASSSRSASFERLYDLPERVIPPEIAARPTPGSADATLELTARALAALGVADLAAIADYFRLGASAVRESLARLEGSGEAERVQVGDRPEPWWQWTAAARPRRVEGQALVSPFDSLAFERRRLETLFGFRYRLEIYVPAFRRQHGYYVYPFLLDEAFAARVDLKADRRAGVLKAQAAWLEPGQRAGEVAPRLAAELRTVAGWLGMADVSATRTGTLGDALADAIS